MQQKKAVRNEQQLSLDLSMLEAERARTTCAAGTRIMIDGITKTAGEWAAERGIKWQTVKMRRMRGDGWRLALDPDRPRGMWMAGWMMAPRHEMRA